MHPLKAILVMLLFISCNTQASDNITFSTTLGYSQEEEHVTLTFDTGETCELHVKQGADSTSYDSCTFQLTEQIHTVSIKGETRYKEEDQIKTASGTGKDLIINLKKEFELLNNASNIDELFTIYNTAISYINSELPPSHHVAPLIFTNKETLATIREHQKKHDVGLPRVYIQMISNYGYPEFFIPLSEQRSIDDIYMNGFSYSTEQFNHHKGIEKNKAFFQKDYEEVYHVFHDETKMQCNGEPIVDMTIATEGDYRPIDVANINIKEDCSQFFNFLKEYILDRFQFQASIEYGEPTPTLSFFGNGTFEAELNSGWAPNGIYYYFN